MSNVDFGEMSAIFAEQAALAAERNAAHRAECNATRCGECERWPCAVCGQLLPANREHCADCSREVDRRKRFESVSSLVPKRSRESDLNASWLKSLVGEKLMRLAADSVNAERCTFIGKPGSGKTSLAAAMFKHRLLSTGGHGMFLHAYDLAKARRNAALGEEAPLVAKALTTPILVIDELGGEEAQYASAVYEVIHERYAEELPTWITTGVGPKELAARYGGGITRRVFEGVVGFRMGEVK